MQVYLVPGTGTTFTQSGTGNRGATLMTLVLSGSSFTVPFVIEGSTQMTKGGVTRTMLKATLSTPKYRGSMSDAGVYAFANEGGTEENSFHGVLTLSPGVKLMLQSSASKADAIELIRKMVAAIVATATGNQSALATSVADVSPLLLGAQGLYPLDVTTGTYGKATA